MSLLGIEPHKAIPIRDESPTNEDNQWNIGKKSIFLHHGQC